MTGEKLKEFIRRLTAEGYEPQLDEHREGTVRDGERSVMVMDDGEVRYKPEYRELGDRVYEIYNEVDEYMSEFLAAEAGTHVESGVDKNDFDRRGVARETRTLALYANCELAMHYNADA
ncbi:MAG: hypothetical protein LBU32_24955 [Clostridiales bacterium]|nr:hypothetical protein [Clostridiales bacterium]